MSRERPVGTGTDGTPAGGAWLVRAESDFFLGKPRKKGSRFALARLIVKFERLLYYGTECSAGTAVRYHGGSRTPHPPTATNRL